jgi:hypothetical protein
MEKREELLKNVLTLIEKYKITAYEIEQNTELSAVGVQKIINGETKKPLSSTLKTIMDYIEKKYINNSITGDNIISGSNHKINQGGIYNDNEGNNSITDRLIHLLEEKDKQIAKKDEQIDKLLYIISNQSNDKK